MKTKPAFKEKEKCPEDVRKWAAIVADVVGWQVSFWAMCCPDGVEKIPAKKLKTDILKLLPKESESYNEYTERTNLFNFKGAHK